jgi:hypothetical protein
MMKRSLTVLDLAAAILIHPSAPLWAARPSGNHLHAAGSDLPVQD